MKLFKFLLIIIIAFLLIGGTSPTVTTDTSDVPEIQRTSTETLGAGIEEESHSEPAIIEATLTPMKVPLESKAPITPTSYPVPDLYGCTMSLEFTSGPLENRTSTFSVLDRSYFLDKADKFAIGKETGVYYEENPYLILHSGYLNGNVLKAMEAEFIRKFLEGWGNGDAKYIQNQINALVGSQALWTCNGEVVLETTINSIVRLSYEASNRLWLEPTEIEAILADNEGLTSEWIGDISPTDDPSLYLGFCGWGASSLESGRYTHYRYLVQFSIQSP